VSHAHAFWSCHDLRARKPRTFLCVLPVFLVCQVMHLMALMCSVVCSGCLFGRWFLVRGWFFWWVWCFIKNSGRFHFRFLSKKLKKMIFMICDVFYDPFVICDVFLWCIWCVFDDTDGSLFALNGLYTVLARRAHHKTPSYTS